MKDSSIQHTEPLAPPFRQKQYRLYDIYYVYYAFLSHEMILVSLLQLFGVKYMGSLLPILPDLFRELRFWGTSTTCPWGAIGLALVCTAAIFWCCGFLAATVLFSSHCRRLITYLARLLVVGLQPVDQRPVDLRSRLAEYSRGH